MKIGIVGSRTFLYLWMVKERVSDYPIGTIIVSGGARGVDTTAVEQAKECGLKFIEHLPQIPPGAPKWLVAKCMNDRNQLIVNDSDKIVAFTENVPHGKYTGGGTWDTIRRARKKGIPVEIIDGTQRNLI